MVFHPEDSEIDATHQAQEVNYDKDKIAAITFGRR
jgi:hypothetical protein